MNRKTMTRTACLLAALALVGACAEAVSAIEEAKSHAKGTWTCEGEGVGRLRIDVADAKAVVAFDDSPYRTVLDWSVGVNGLSVQEDDVMRNGSAYPSLSSEVGLTEKQGGFVAAALESSASKDSTEQVFQFGGSTSDVEIDLEKETLRVRSEKDGSSTTTCHKTSQAATLHMPTAADVLATRIGLYYEHTFLHPQPISETLSYAKVDAEVKVGGVESFVVDSADTTGYPFEVRLLQVTTPTDSVCVYLTEAPAVHAADAAQDNLATGEVREDLSSLDGWSIARRTNDGTGACQGVEFASGRRADSSW